DLQAGFSKLTARLRFPFQNVGKQVAHIVESEFHREQERVAVACNLVIVDVLDTGKQYNVAHAFVGGVTENMVCVVDHLLHHLMRTSLRFGHQVIENPLKFQNLISSAVVIVVDHPTDGFGTNSPGTGWYRLLQFPFRVVQSSQQKYERISKV